MKICELKIDGYDDRSDIVAILAHNGYRVSIEEREDPHSYLKKIYWVVVEDNN